MTAGQDESRPVQGRLVAREKEKPMHLDSTHPLALLLAAAAALLRARHFVELVESRRDLRTWRANRGQA